MSIKRLRVYLYAGSKECRNLRPSNRITFSFLLHETILRMYASRCRTCNAKRANRNIVYMPRGTSFALHAGVTNSFAALVAVHRSENQDRIEICVTRVNNSCTLLLTLYTLLTTRVERENYKKYFRWSYRGKNLEGNSIVILSLTDLIFGKIVICRFHMISARFKERNRK